MCAHHVAAYCSNLAVRSCECARRCHEYLCMQTDHGEKCHEFPDEPRWPCFTRVALPPEQQHSMAPEAGEAGVKCFQGYLPDAKEIPCADALGHRKEATMPLSQCKDRCNQRGYCIQVKGEDRGAFCMCDRGFAGEACEAAANSCYKGCNGRGTCRDGFCHCQPPYFSIGCTRKNVYPVDFSRPSPVNFKIYMYELDSRVAFEKARHPGGGTYDPHYLAYSLFLDQFLESKVRTEDPSEASLFFLPAFNMAYTGPAAYVYHFIPLSKFVTRRKWCMFAREYGCIHPLRDVIAVPHQARDDAFVDAIAGMSVDDVLKSKTRLFSFVGGTRHFDPEYSGLTRQLLHNLTQAWNDADFEFVVGGVPNYPAHLRRTKFCLAPYGHGWGIRLVQAMLTGCVPVIVQEHVVQYYEDVLPYETFSIRLNNEDLPNLRELLRSVTDEQYRRLLKGVLEHRLAFSWNIAKGGKAFDYTLLSLRRKYLNLKSLYVGTYDRATQ
ncbi:hypothetical protein ABPG77_002483 [Micractinium sp. CCAP 211/92]